MRASGVHVGLVCVGGNPAEVEPLHLGTSAEMCVCGRGMRAAVCSSRSTCCVERSVYAYNPSPGMLLSDIGLFLHVVMGDVRDVCTTCSRTC